MEQLAGIFPRNQNRRVDVGTINYETFRGERDGMGTGTDDRFRIEPGIDYACSFYNKSSSTRACINPGARPESVAATTFSTTGAHVRSRTRVSERVCVQVP